MQHGLILSQSMKKTAKRLKLFCKAFLTTVTISYDFLLWDHVTDMSQCSSSQLDFYSCPFVMLYFAITECSGLPYPAYLHMKLILHAHLGILVYTDSERSSRFFISGGGGRMKYFNCLFNYKVGNSRKYISQRNLVKIYSQKLLLICFTVSWKVFFKPFSSIVTNGLLSFLINFVLACFIDPTIADVIYVFIYAPTVAREEMYWDLIDSFRTGNIFVRLF